MKCKQCALVDVIRGRKFCSQRCYWKSLEGIKGEKAPNYRKVVGKRHVHDWLTVHYGNIKECEGKDCKGKSRWYDWALKKGKKYERNRGNFLRLCRSCHRKYDMTPEKMKQAVSNLRKFNPYYGTERKNMARTV